MPIWAPIYLAVLTLSSLYSIKIFRSIPWFWVGEGLALCSVYAFFLFDYEIVSRPDSLVYVLLIAAYIIYWEYWVFKNFFAFLMPEHSSTGKEIFFTMMLTFFPLFYIIIDVIMFYFGSDF